MDKQSAATSLVITLKNQEKRFFSMEHLMHLLGLPDIQEIGIRIENQDNVQLDATASVDDTKYPGIDVDAYDASGKQIYLTRAKLPNESFPDTVTAILYAGYACYEHNAPIAIVPTKLLNEKELAKRADANQNANYSPTKLIHIDYDLARPCPWNDTEHLREHDSEYESKRFLLIEVVDRDIQEPVSFSSRKEAHDAMMQELKSVMKLTDEDIRNADVYESNIINDETGKPYETGMYIDDGIFFGDWHASCEQYGQNYNWFIFEQNN